MTLLLAIGGERATQGFSIFQQVAAISSLYSLTRLMAGSLTASLCTIGYATVPPVIYFSGCGYVEPALLMTLGGSLLILLLSFRSKAETNVVATTGLGHISLIGFLGGWMVALKYNGLIYLGLIGMILLWSYRRAPSKRALNVIGVFSLSAAPGFCWMGWNWVTLGNPVYPMAWFLFGGKGWDEARTLSMSLYFDVYGMGRSPLDYLLLPWRLAFSGRFDSIRFDGAMGPFLLLFLALSVVSGYLLIRRWKIRDMTKQIGFMFIISTAFFVFGTQQTRFWLPSQMLACAFAAPAIELLVNGARRKHTIKIILFLVVIGSLAWNMWFLGKQFFAVGYYRPVLGLEDEKDFLVRNVPGYPALEFINQNLSSHSYLLCIWTGAYGYYINPKYYSDTFIEDITLKELIHTSVNEKELSQKLMQAGFTHLFLNLSILGKNMKENERAIFDEFLRGKTHELFRYRNYRVYKIYQ
jgi:4-amino-4-deoxy-L-arabinose transferase-like glycosyltransferase